MNKLAGMMVLICSLMLSSANAEISLKMSSEKKIDIFKVCNNDISTFCDHIEPGGGKLFFCLSKRLDTLEHKCKKLVVEQLDKAAE